MDLSVFELVFFFIIKDNAVIIKKAHNWCFPAWAPQEIDNDIEKPVLYSINSSIFLLHFLIPMLAKAVFVLTPLFFLHLYL